MKRLFLVLQLYTNYVIFSENILLLKIQFMSYNTLSPQHSPSSTLLYYLTNTVLSCALIQPCILIQGSKIKMFKKYKNKLI